MTYCTVDANYIWQTPRQKDGLWTSRKKDHVCSLERSGGRSSSERRTTEVGEDPPLVWKCTRTEAYIHRYIPSEPRCLTEAA